MTLVLFFACTLSASAQLGNPSAESVQFFITPENPGSNELVKIRVESFTSDLNSKEITWSLNDKIQKKAVGDKNFEFTTGPLGSVSKITFSTNTITKSVTLRPVDLFITWQTNTYTPPFYKGKAVYTNQSSIQFVALPMFVGSNGKTIDPKNLIYKWTRDDSVLNNESGYGKQVLSTSGGTLAKPILINLEVTSADGLLKAKREIEVEGNLPRIIFYENHPLYGITYRNALPDIFTLTSKEISLVAAPYFFDISGKLDSNLSYVWKMNGEVIENQENPSTLTLRRPEGSAGGKANISLMTSHLAKIIQFTNKSLDINFEALNISD